MEIQKIKNGVAAVFVGAGELAERGIVSGFGSDTAKSLAKEAFTILGERDAGDISVDVYLNGCGLLLFAEKAEPKKYARLFPTLEELLTYVTKADDDAASRLVLYEGKYCLISECICETDDDSQICTQDMLSSRVLIENDALSSLRACFKV